MSVHSIFGYLTSDPSPTNTPSSPRWLKFFGLSTHLGDPKKSKLPASTRPTTINFVSFMSDSRWNILSVPLYSISLSSFPPFLSVNLPFLSLKKITCHQFTSCEYMYRMHITDKLRQLATHPFSSSLYSV